MRDLFRAEWAKIVGHRWATSCMIWIFPVGAVGFFIVMSLILLVSTPARTEFAAETNLWTDSMISAWSVPNNPLGRLLLIGFTAVMFAGEYQWQTWKNILPRHERGVLILIKFLTLGTLVVFAFVLMSVIILIGMSVLVWIAGGTLSPEVTGDVLADFAGDYALQAALAFTSTLIAAGYAALAALLTRSILGGVLVGFVATFVENLSAGGLMLIAFFLKFPEVLHLYRLTPGYNLLNVNEWIINDHALAMELPYSDTGSILLSNSLIFSVGVLALWVFGLIALVAYLFHRQDITS